MAKQNTAGDRRSRAPSPEQVDLLLDDLLDEVDCEYSRLLASVVANRRVHSRLLELKGLAIESPSWDPDQPLRIEPDYFLPGRFDPTRRKSFVLQLLAEDSHRLVKPSEVRAAFLAEEGAVEGELSPKVVDQVLFRMADAGLLVRSGRGLYRLPTFTEAADYVCNDRLRSQALQQLLKEGLM
jgi:hypothetical protein